MGSIIQGEGMHVSWADQPAQQPTNYRARPMDFLAQPCDPRSKIGRIVLVHSELRGRRLSAAPPTEATAV
ncbi:hypothetical protein E2562_009252 [Oryza meyeriana var. granulata]|uniref:Uncharacterized protein n=1 Tax=Oryza meyeriana var. granulata TaxID=110450 RepID=A0A6G1D0L9_9ORYZ|nr:hypothetical protein E2562_009252 [Oryza meyeriana var. granulata]